VSQGEVVVEMSEPGEVVVEVGEPPGSGRCGGE